MRKDTARLLGTIDDTIGRLEPNLAERVTVNLHVCPIEDRDMGENKDMGIRYHLSEGRRLLENADGFLKLTWTENPLFPRTQARRAEEIAMEAYTYFASQGKECRVQHCPLKFLDEYR